MPSRREREPSIHRGDKILITAGGAAGTWDVRDARWAKRDETSDQRVELVLGRGSMQFKTIFNAQTMRHQTEWPADKLSRDINVQKPLKYRPR
jgi:hypothetical protein